MNAGAVPTWTKEGRTIHNTQEQRNSCRKLKPTRNKELNFIELEFN